MLWTQQRIQEAANCVRSPEYYIDNFVWMDGDEGILQFNMGKEPEEDYFYQREIIRNFLSGNNGIVLKNRRAGLSWGVAALTDWIVNFNPGWRVLFLSRGEAEAISLLSKVKFIHKNLHYKDHTDITKATPANWLANEIIVDNQRMMGVGHANDEGEYTIISVAQSLTTTKRSGVGEKSKLVFIDEVESIEHQDEVFGSVLTTGARAGNYIVGSNAGVAGTLFHKMCLMGQAGENKTFWFRHVFPHESGVTQEMMDKTSEILPDDIKRQQWYGEFIQSGNAVFDATHLAACYKPIKLYPEIKTTLEEYRQKVIDTNGMYYYFSGVDSAVGKAHRRSKEKDFNAFTCFTASGIQAFAYYDKKPLNSWAGSTVVDNGIQVSVPGKVSQLHKEWPGLAMIEEDGPGYTVLNRHQLPEDGISNVKPVSMKHHLKNRLIRNLIIAIESHAIVITDEKTYQQLSMYQMGETPDTYEAMPGFNDDLVMALAMALEGLRIEGGIELSFSGGVSLDELTLSPYDKQYQDLIELNVAKVAPIRALPAGLRPGALMPRIHNTEPDPIDWRFMPKPDIMEKLNG